MKQIVAELTPVLRRWQDRRGGQRATKRAPLTGDQLTVWTAQVNGHGEIPDASHTQKIIGKPQARFERGLMATGQR